MEDWVNSFFDGIALLAAVIGGIIVLISYTDANMCAFGIGIAAIPYFFSSINRRVQIIKILQKRDRP